MAAKPAKSRSSSSFGRPALWFGAAIVMAACSVGPPFPSYDPPPTFAYYYTPQDPLDAQRTGGSLLVWTYLADMVHPTFLPTGGTTNASHSAPFYVWKTIPFARWPAKWKVESTNGCGKGTSAFIDVTQKLVNGLQCAKKVGGNASMDPEEYWANDAPSSITFQFEPTEVPESTSATVYFVDENGDVVADYGTSVDSSGVAVTSAPTVEPGYYYILVEFHDLEHDGVQLELHVLNPDMHPVAGSTLPDPDHRRHLVVGRMSTQLHGPGGALIPKRAALRRD